MEKDLVGIVSVLHTEIEAPLNLLCDDRNKLLSESLSLRCSFAIYCVAFWQVFNAPLAVMACRRSQRSRARERGCSAPLLLHPPFSSISPPAPSPGHRDIAPAIFHLPTAQLCITDWYFWSRALCRMPLETPLAQLSGRRRCCWI